MTDIIQSTQNPVVKRLKSLSTDAAARRDAGLFLIEGSKLVLEALSSGLKLKQAFFSLSCKVMPELRKSGVELTELSEKALAFVSDTETPQGVLLLLEIPKAVAILPSKVSLTVAAEKLQDPGNLGTILRSAWACAADAVYLSDGCTDVFAPKSVRAAAGAQLHLNIESHAVLPRQLAELAKAGVQVLALEPTARQSLWDVNLTVPTCFVVGSEGQGLSEQVLECCTKRIRLDYPAQTESLNAGVCLSIALFEALRQRHK